MGKVNNTCFGCQKKKQKCDRGRPSCQGCLISQIDCVYPPNAGKSVSKRRQSLSKEKENEMVDKLIKLESAFKASKSNLFGFVPDFSLFSDGVQAAHNLQDPLCTGFTECEEELAMVREHVIEQMSNMTHISKEFFSKLLDSSVMYTFAARAAYYFHHDGLHYEAKTLVWLEKAVGQFAQSLSFPCPANLLATLLLAVIHFKMDKINEGLAYFGFTVRLAKDLGINREESIMLISSDENEIEDLRKVWWWLYHIDQNLVYNNLSFIRESDHGIYLPGTAAMDDRGKAALLGISVMSSEDWFTPNLPGLPVYAYKVLLTRLFGKALKYNYLYRYENNSVDYLYLMSTLEGSLTLWYLSLPREFTMHLEVLCNPVISIVDPKSTWFALDTIVQFYFTKIMISTPICYNNIVEDYTSATKCPAFANMLVSCKQISAMIAFYLTVNPTFNYCSPYFMTYIFQSTVPMICALKMEIPGEDPLELQKNIQMHMSAIRTLIQNQRRGPVILELLEYLLSLPNPVLVVQDFYKFVLFDSNPLSHHKYSTFPTAKYFTAETSTPGSQDDMESLLNSTPNTHHSPQTIDDQSILQFLKLS
ncbi:hypothetical protein HDV01_004557 [Terramyces sp. JEL0728]|nr:hypothetical protein HDV01_004557 [Terramyces sp. JEL0728]